jgi:hypothetical protein
MDQELKQYLEGMEERLLQQSRELSTLIENVKESMARGNQGRRRSRGPHECTVG